MYKGRQELDDEAWDKNEDDEKKSLELFRRTTTRREVEALATQKCGKPASFVPPLVMGSFNILYRMRLEGEDPSPDVMVRLPLPFSSRFIDEKVVYEAATAEYLRLHTRIPVAQVLHYGRSSAVGPFLIIRCIEGQGNMTRLLEVPRVDRNLVPVLNPELSADRLRSLWGKMAWCLLELSKPTLPRIGSLVERDDGSFAVAGRPLTQNMSNMTQLANIPPSVLPLKDDTYATADGWYTALAEMHIAQLVFQHNDLITSENDCRNKYVSRQLFRRLAKQGRLSTFGFAEDNWSAATKTTPQTCRAPDRSGSFRLWCDDYRPSNVLIGAGSDDVAAVIDWEFAYAAPTQFALDPPWWLLFEMPEMWASGIDGWGKDYEPALKTWLEAVEECEAAAAAAEEEEEKRKAEQGGLSAPLSAYMRESWETGRFWLSYAARKSWAFDAVFWTYLDERFFGERSQGIVDEDLWKTRLHLLSFDEQQAMEPFVRRKMEESRQRTLVDWHPDEARRRLAELLFD